MNIFIPVVGQFTNIGDSLHRRVLLSWVKDLGTLHIYAGDAPKTFIDSLRIDKNAILYTSLTKWLLAIVISGYKQTHFFFNPGEIRLGLRRFAGELLLLPFIILVRLKKGEVIRVGIAIMENSSTKFSLIWRLFFSLSSKIYWRTNHSKTVFKIGDVIPDLAFYLTEPNKKENRNYLTISMRSGRQFPSEKWFSLIEKVAIDYKLKPIVISQVRSDNSNTLKISEKLNSEFLIWEDNDSHNTQEQKLDAIYSNTKMVISDRLHVLIAAHTKGGIPINFLPKMKLKVDYHYEAIGINSITVTTENKEDDQVYSFISERMNIIDFFESKSQEAKSTLELTKNEIHLLVKKN